MSVNTQVNLIQLFQRFCVQGIDVFIWLVNKYRNNFGKENIGKQSQHFVEKEY